MVGILQLAAESLVQERLFQGGQGGKFLLVEGGEVLGFLRQRFQRFDDARLFINGGQGQNEIFNLLRA